MEDVDNMTPQEKQDVLRLVKKYFSYDNELETEDKLEKIAQHFNENYNCCHWNAFIYDSYAIQSFKDIQISLGEDSFLLFGYAK